MAVLAALCILFLCTIYKHAWLLFAVFFFALFFPSKRQRYREAKIKEAMQQEREEIDTYLASLKKADGKTLPGTSTNGIRHNGISPTSHIQYEEN